MEEQTKSDLKEQLDRLSISYRAKSTKDELQELLASAITGEAITPPEPTPEAPQVVPDGACDVFGAFDASSVDCTDCPVKIQCTEARPQQQPEKAKAAPKPRTSTGPRVGVVKAVKGRYSDVEELRRDIEQVEVGSLTIALNKALVRGVTLKELATVGTETAAALGVKPRGEASVKAHMTAMTKQCGWIFSTDEEGIIMVVGLDNENRAPRTDHIKKTKMV